MPFLAIYLMDCETDGEGSLALLGNLANIMTVKLSYCYISHSNYNTKINTVGCSYHLHGV